MSSAHGVKYNYNIETEIIHFGCYAVLVSEAAVGSYVLHTVPADNSGRAF
jgi:hypothetical protein